MNKIIAYDNDHPSLAALNRAFDAANSRMAAAKAAEHEAREHQGTLNEKDFLPALDRIDNAEFRMNFILKQRQLRTAYDGALLACEVALSQLKKALSTMEQAVDRAIDDHSLKSAFLEWRVGMNNVLAALALKEVIETTISRMEVWIRPEKDVNLAIYPNVDMLLHSYAEAVRKHRAGRQLQARR